MTSSSNLSQIHISHGRDRYFLRSAFNCLLRFSAHCLLASNHPTDKKCLHSRVAAFLAPKGLIPPTRGESIRVPPAQSTPPQRTSHPPEAKSPRRRRAHPRGDVTVETKARLSNTSTSRSAATTGLPRIEYGRQGRWHGSATTSSTRESRGDPRSGRHYGLRCRFSGIPPRRARRAMGLVGWRPRRLF
jgi:hypothetical protein